MMFLGVGTERKRNVPIERFHKCDPRKHHVTAAAAQHQRLDRCVPFRQIRFLLRQLGDVVGRVLQRQQLPVVRQNNGILERG